MNARQRSSFLIPGRRGWLLGVLAAMLALLVFWRHDVLLAYRLNAAQRAIRSREFDAAIDVLARSKDRGQRSAQWQYLSACALRRRGEVQPAAEHLAAAEQLGWNQADLQRQQLLLEAQAGQIKAVEGQLVELLQAGSSDQAAEETYEAMARGYLASFHVADAAKCLKFWVEWQPDNPLPHLWQGDLDRRQNNLAAAARQYQQVLKVDPTHREARLKLAQTEVQRLNVDEAAALFEQCLLESPPTPDALLGLAECRRRQGSTEQARSLLHDALTHELTQVQSAAALASLGRLAMEERNYAPAIANLQQSIQRDPNVPASRLTLAGALVAVGQEDAAEAQREAARGIVERHQRLLGFTAQAAAEPTNAEARSQAGLLLMEQGMLSAGADWLKTAVAIEPHHRAANEALAAYYRQIGDNELAGRHASLAAQAPQATAEPKQGDHD